MTADIGVFTGTKQLPGQNGFQSHFGTIGKASASFPSWEGRRRKPESNQTSQDSAEAWSLLRQIILRRPKSPVHCENRQCQSKTELNCFSFMAAEV